MARSLLWLLSAPPSPPRILEFLCFWWGFCFWKVLFVFRCFLLLSHNVSSGVWSYCLHLFFKGEIGLSLMSLSETTFFCLVRDSSLFLWVCFLWRHALSVSFTNPLAVSFPHSPQAVTEKEISRCRCLLQQALGRSTTFEFWASQGDREPASRSSTWRSGLTQRDR